MGVVEVADLVMASRESDEEVLEDEGEDEDDDGDDDDDNGELEDVLMEGALAVVV